MPEGTTIWAAAREVGIEIPVLCHDERYDPVGVCRMCVVDVGARVYAAACVRPCEDGMEVKTATPELDRNRAQLTELLLVDQPPVEEDPKQTTTADNELLVLVRQYGLEQEASELARGSGRGEDFSNPVIAVNHDACILCDRCVRACDDIQGNDVIGRSGKGYSTRIAFDLNDPMGESSCVTCGECVAACPTGALTNKPINGVPIRPRSELRQVDTVCPYCGVGCALTFNVDDERKAIAYADGRSQPGSQRRLCVKGRYGWDYSVLQAAPDHAADPARVELPEGSAEQRRPRRRGSRPPAQAGRPRRLRGGHAALPRGDLGGGARPRRVAAEGDPRRARPGAIAGFGSAKCSNEEAYLFQKLIRAGFGTNNIDHCTRLCHASSVAALFEGVGSGAVSTTYGDIVNADVAILGRHEHDGQPPGRLVVLQAGPAPRHEADRRRPAPRADRRPRRHLLPDQARHRRRLLQRRHARGHHARPRRPRVHRRAHVELRRAGRSCSRTTRPSAPSRSPASTPTPSASSPACGARPAPASSTGAWGSRSTRRAPTTRAA